MTKILVLEDDLPSLKLMRDILEVYNYQVIEASDGLDAIAIAEAEKPNLAILDVMLPSLNGFQVCERLRKIPALKFIPIIILTVLNENQHRIRAIEAGANDFLIKPFNRVELLTKIKALLQRQEELKKLVPFQSTVQCLLTALGKRDPAALKRGLRVAYLAERVALTLGAPADEVDLMKKGASLMNIGVLGLPAGVDANAGPPDALHTEIGSEMMDCFDIPIIRNIIRYHHGNLWNTPFPDDLPENQRLLIHITSICSLYDRLRQGDLHLSMTASLARLEEETRQGLWPEEVFSALKQVVATGNSIEQ